MLEKKMEKQEKNEIGGYQFLRLAAEIGSYASLLCLLDELLTWITMECWLGHAGGLSFSSRKTSPCMLVCVVGL